MKKRIISLLTAAAMMMPMTAVNAGAFGYGYFIPGSERFNNYVQGCEYLEKFSDENALYYYVHNISENKTENYYEKIKVFNSYGKVFHAYLDIDADRDELDNLMNELAPDIEYRVSISRSEEKKLYVWMRDKKARPETDAVIKQLCEEFKKRFDVEEFTFSGHLYTYDYYELHPSEGFPYTFFNTGAAMEDVQAVIDENGLDYELSYYESDIERYSDCFRIIPTRIMDFDESTEQLMPFIEKYGLSGFDLAMNKPTSGADSDDSLNIDVLNSVNGDANCDNVLTVADATAVLQSIGNPDKYGLSDQAKFNADIYNTGDGVTALDALKILRIEAGLE